MTTTPSPAFERAKLIPFLGEQPDPDVQQQITVLFNPSTLRVSLQNQMKSEKSAKDSNKKASQYVESSSSTLNVELLFDTTMASPGVEAHSDVRILTGRIVNTFIKPQGEGDKKDPPKKMQFSWGSFLFNGLVTSYQETLDYFAPEGVPLRATLSLTLTEDSFQYERDAKVRAAQRAQPQLSDVPANKPLAKSMQDSGKDPRDWRSMALFNGMESPRLSVGVGDGFGVGVSLGAGASLSAGVGAGVSAGASFGAGLSTALESGVGVAAQAGEAVEAQARAQLSAGVGLSYGASTTLGSGIPGAFTMAGGAVTCRW